MVHFVDLLPWPLYRAVNPGIPSCSTREVLEHWATFVFVTL